MRTFGVAAALALTLAAGGIATGVAVADDQTPSKSDVREARDAASAAALDVDGVRARLVVANQRLQQSAVAAAQAAEAYNGARWKAAEARKAARAAHRRASIAQGDVERQRATYSDAIVTSYELVPGLTGLSAVVRSDGIETVLQRTATMQNAEDALDGQYDEFRAAATLAEVAADQADDADADAQRAADDALDAREAARSAADRAAAEAQSVADEKAGLIARLADLQHVSVRLAQRRQSALEQRAAEAAARAAQKEQHAQEQAQQQAQQQPTAAPDPAPSDPEPNTPSTPSTPNPPTPPAPATPPAPPVPAGGASAAIAFARAQIGEPYRWGAAGPSSWDCSGLTMGAWGAGGRSLPHYSVAQYEQSTPISAGSLQPGDLVFWGSSSSPGSIYHVALYVGGGTIIQAPRTGVPVQEVSMYAWTPPNFYARP